MSTKLRKSNNTYITADEIASALVGGSGITYGAEPSGTQNYLQVPDAGGNLVDTTDLQYTQNWQEIPSDGGFGMAVVDLELTDQILSNSFGMGNADIFFQIRTDIFNIYSGPHTSSFYFACDADGRPDYASISIGNGEDSLVALSATDRVLHNSPVHQFCNFAESFNLMMTIQWARTTINTDLRLTSIPTSAAGLSAGDVWNDSGTLKIV